MMGYPRDEIFREVAFIAYYLHWPMDEIMSLDHRERQQWVAEISKINERLNREDNGRT
jgi:hypothetical protein